jgi:hypothetical protein
MNKRDACWLTSVIDTRMRTTAPASIPDYSYRGQEKRIPSLNTGIGNAVMPEQKVYTGTKMLGVSQLHKSNAVPVFSQEEIVDISKMRR